MTVLQIIITLNWSDQFNVMTISQKIIRKLEKEILTGAYSPGTKFPSEREIAGMYGISRSTARETIKSLSRIGLIETRPQSGSVVKDYEAEASLDLLIHIMKYQEVDNDIFLSLLEFRKLVEVHAVERAAENARKEDINLLREIVKNEQEPTLEPSKMTEYDYELHSIIIRLSGNLVIGLVFNSFRPVYRIYTELFFGLPGTLGATIDQHERLVRAIESGDGVLARAVMAEALDYGERRVREFLDSN